MTIQLETGPIERFATPGDYASYCLMVLPWSGLLSAVVGDSSTKNRLRVPGVVENRFTVYDLSELARSPRLMILAAGENRMFSLLRRSSGLDCVVAEVSSGQLIRGAGIVLDGGSQSNYLSRRAGSLALS